MTRSALVFLILSAATATTAAAMYDPRTGLFAASFLLFVIGLMNIDTGGDKE